MAKFVARVTILIDSPSVSDTSEAHNAIIELMSARPGVENWDYVTIDGLKTEPMFVDSPSVDELFEAALSDQ